MKRLTAALAALILLSSCVSGDFYTNSLTFIERWNALEEVKSNDSFKIDENTIWHESNGDDIRYAVWLEESSYLLVLLCDSKTDSVKSCSFSARFDDDGKISDENSKKYYTFLSMMLRAMCDIEAAAAENILEQGGFKLSDPARYYEQNFHGFSLISDDLGVSFRIENQRLLPKEIPELTLEPTITRVD